MEGVGPENLQRLEEQLEKKLLTDLQHPPKALKSPSFPALFRETCIGNLRLRSLPSFAGMAAATNAFIRYLIFSVILFIPVVWFLA